MPWVRKADAPFVVVLDAGIWSTLLVRWPWLQYLAPALAGEVLDVTTFCAAGPLLPAVTMDDIVWFGFPPNDGRPHTILTVTRAIARAEAFAAYCEFPGNSTPSWHVLADVCELNETGGQDVCIWSAPLTPNTSTQVRVTYHSGPGSDLHTSVTAGQAHIVGTGIDTNGPLETGKLNGPAATEGNVATNDFTSWRSGNPTVGLYPAVYVGGGSSSNPEPFCFTVEWFGSTGTAEYQPPEPVEDPDVDLPDGTGATVDQLEVKLDMLQQWLRLNRGAAGVLDPDSASPVDDQATGELGDALGVLVSIQSRPSTRSSWSADPPTFPRMARLTFGNADGWWQSVDVEHEQSVFSPLPLGATRWTLTCEAPMTAIVTLYRPLPDPT